MYGTQTVHFLPYPVYEFENDVKMYGTQTMQAGTKRKQRFENDVKMYGTQTNFLVIEKHH